MLKQMQLTEAVKRRLPPANFEPDKDLYVALAITESIRAWMKELKSTKYHGRFPNDARAAYRAVHQAAATDCKEPLRARVLCTKRALRDTARLFEMSPQTLEQSRDRFAQVVLEHFAELQGKMRKERVRPLSSPLAVGALRARRRAIVP